MTDSRAVSDERKAQALVKTATAAYRSQIQDAACLSDLMRERLLQALDVITDEIPSDLVWSEAISNLKRGYHD